jgi:hypothetical protein
VAVYSPAVWRSVRVVGFAIGDCLLALPTSALTEAPSAAAEGRIVAMVEALVAAKPARLEELQGVVGPLDRGAGDALSLKRGRLSDVVEAVDAAFSFDPFHQPEPALVKNPRLSRYVLQVAGGYGPAVEALRKRIGPPTVLADNGGEVLAFGPFYMRPAANAGQFSIAWYASTPEFAIPARTPAESSALADGIGILLRDGPSRAALERAFGPLRWEAQGATVAAGTWKLEARLREDGTIAQVGLRFLRPLPAAGIVAALGTLGWKDVVVGSSDAHMALWNLQDQSRRLFTAGSYVVSFRVRHTALEQIGLSRGVFLWRADGAEIEYVSFEPPRSP